MKKLRYFIIIILLFVSLVGCAETKILERIGVTTLVGYDLGDDDMVETTAIIRQVSPEFQSRVEIITTKDKTSKGTRIKTNLRSSKKIQIGQMRIVLFGEDLAKDGLRYYTDTLLENPAVSNSLFMAVVEGRTQPLLEYKYENIEDIGQHIFKLVEQNITNEHLISSTLHEVAHDYDSIGMDMSMPILKRDKEVIAITDVALFKRDKMVGTLSVNDSFYLKLVRNNFQSGMLEMILTKDDLSPSLMKHSTDGIPLVFDTVRTVRDVKLINKKAPEFDLHIKMNARLLEIKSDINTGDPKQIAALEKAIKKNLTRELSRVIAYCQEVDSDVFGFGEVYRSSVRNSNLTHEKWHEMYKEVKVNVKIDFTIIRNGVFE